MLARNLTPSPAPPQGGVPSSPERVKESPSDTGATSKKKNKNQPPRLPRRNPTTPVVNTPPDTGATSKKKNKNPLACPAAGRGAIHSVVARRRMTTPVVNTPPDTGAIPKEKKPSSFRNFPRG